VAIERARAVLLSKPWGVSDVARWSAADHGGRTIGEICFERSSAGAAGSALLFKLLFTSEALSIQVHPDDGFAQAIGLARGKSEAWYVLDAAPGAKVALGLSRHVTPNQLREAVSGGSIVDLVAWRAVFAGNVIRVPAGTIHAIGAGLVIAEIQQHSDATFRLFDHGRGRELHVESAIAVADAGPAELQVPPVRLTDERTVLVSDPHFVLEKFDLPPNSIWRADIERETWFLVLRGGAQMGQLGVTMGDAVFAEFDRIEIDTGLDGLVCLVAHAGVGVAPVLVQDVRSFHAGQRVELPEMLLAPRVDQPGGAALYPQSRTVQ
jgi:mannose-6-phosphate isomerase